MPETPGDARITELPDGLIPALAELYDKFAHSLEPFSEERDNAEQTCLGKEISLNRSQLWFGPARSTMKRISPGWPLSRPG